MRDHNAVQRKREIYEISQCSRELRDHMAVNRYKTSQGSRER